MGKKVSKLKMELNNTPKESACHRAVCKLCGEKIYTPQRVLLKYDNEGMIGYVHDDCLTQAYY